jgi:hypothetical protein
VNRYYTILCEDLQAYVFVRHVLISAGAEARNIFKHPYPDSRFNAAGGGSPRDVDGYQVYACGSQHVRMNFPGALAKVRVQHAKRDAGLVVHIDVDNATANGRTVRDRFNELDKACVDANVAVRAATEPVAILVPRREVETWIQLLVAGPPVDEHSAYQKLTGREADCEPAAKAFAAHARANTAPTQAPPSLVVGLAELRRVL